MTAREPGKRGTQERGVTTPLLFILFYYLRREIMDCIECQLKGKEGKEVEESSRGKEDEFLGRWKARRTRALTERLWGS